MLQSRCREMNAVLVIFGFPKTHSFCWTIVVEKRKHCSEFLDVLQMKQHVLIIEEARFELNVSFRAIFLQNHNVATNICSHSCLQHTSVLWARTVRIDYEELMQIQSKASKAEHPGLKGVLF